MPAKRLTPAERAAAAQAEEERAIIREAMAIIGRRRSKIKAAAVRANGRLGGRPRKKPA